MRSFIGWAITLYRRSPFYPHLGRLLARLLIGFTRLRRGGMFVHDLGAFRMHIDLEQRIDAKVYFTGTWEPETVATLQQLLPRGGVAVDVGANIGYLTLELAQRVGESGCVLAFEPTDWTYARLRANVELNAVPQVTIVQAGLSDRPELCEPADIPYGYRLDGRMVTQRQSIRLVTLDDYLAEHPVQRLDFIKCDTDGFELRVFTGAQQTLRRFLPALHFELYQGLPSDSVAQAEALLKLLHEIGYRFHKEGSLQPYDSPAQALADMAPGRVAANLVAIARAPAAAG